MRNLKKILALVLALMMVLSVMVTASAASPLEKFSDVEDVNPDYLEAVTVMVAAGVLNGTDKGLEPQTVLTREQAAVLVTYLATAGDTADYAARCETEYDDVAATHWASGYINYCYENGLILGTGDNKYSPKLSLTYEQYAAMLLRVLGIDYTTDGKWYVPVRNNAKNEGIMAGIESYVWTAELTREAACQMTFNALNWVAEGAATGKYIVEPSATLMAAVKAETAGAADKLALVEEAAEAPFASRADALVYMNALELDLTTDYVIKAQTTAEGTLMASFASKVYASAATDSYGRPLTNVWREAENDTIIYSEEVDSVKTYTSAVDYKTIAADLKGYKLGGVKVEGTTAMTGNIDVFNVANNANGGVYDDFLRSNNQTPSVRLAGISQNGRVLEIYDVDNDKVIDGIVTVTYTVDEIAISTPDANGTVTYTIGSDSYKDYTDEYIAAQAAKKNYLADEIVLNGEIAHEDHVTYVVIGGVAQVYATETVEGILTRKTSTGEYLTIGGEKIAVGNASGATAFDDYVIKADAQKFVLDQYGYVVAEYTEGTPVSTVSTNYVYVLSAQTQAYYAGDVTGSTDLIGGTKVDNAKDPVAVANVVFPDGSNLVINLGIINTEKNPANAPVYKAYLPTSKGEVALAGLNLANYASTNGGNKVNNWFAYTVNEDGTYTLSEIDESVAQVVDDGLTLTKDKVSSFTVGEGKVYTNSATAVTGIKYNTTSKVYDVTSKTGLIGKELAGKVLVTYAEGASTVANIYAIGASMTTVYTPTIYAFIAGAGDEVINGTEYYAYIDGELQVIVINNGEADAPTAGLYKLNANTGKLAGTYATADSGLTQTATGEVELVDATYFVANGETCYYDKYCVVYNLTGLTEGTATGAADVVEAGDYVVVFNANATGDYADSDVDLIYIIDAPEAE